MSAAQRHRKKSHSAHVGVPSTRGRFLRLHDMIASTGMSESTIRRRVEKGEMPKPVALTKRCVGWWECDFLAWVATKREPQEQA